MCIAYAKGGNTFIEVRHHMKREREIARLLFCEDRKRDSKNKST